MLLLGLLASTALLVSGCGQKPSEPDAEAAEQEQANAITADFVPVEFDELIAEAIAEVEKFNGQKTIKPALPVRFKAKKKRDPEAKEMAYVYTALEVAGVTPLPDIQHRMFVESDSGDIIPVYVEKSAAERLTAELPDEASAEFVGYHLYNYTKGPAILVVDFLPTKHVGDAQ
ncbi:hypothetical protein [Cerasicoccus maritimus]|uniref:hypothetical protein n=1 Tax=Cerasicoccus maritimus TaxID=490089 RepID=UPI002852A5A2|nr:hypothetical protein [Cerasicoccus maritimus]